MKVVPTDSAARNTVRPPPAKIKKVADDDVSWAAILDFMTSVHDFQTRMIAKYWREGGLH